MAHEHRPRDGRPQRDRRPGRGAPAESARRPAKGRARDSSPGSSQDRARTPRSAEEQERYDGPPLPEEITGQELDRAVTAQLKGLPERLAARVARHLAAAGLLIDTDPETAYRHTVAARARAARIAVVREACGEAAYAAGEFAEALTELRAAKRMNGATAYLPMMADCERALGRPERALTLAKAKAVDAFSDAQRIEMTIVEAGARRDLGELDAALRTLEAAPLMSASREEWVVRLRYAYADTLAVAGRTTEALEWFHRTEAVDRHDLTDAGDRAAALEPGSGA